MPTYIPSPAVNEHIFNQATVDMVLQDLMTKKDQGCWWR